MRSDIDGADLFALAAALAWLGDQPSYAPRADHLFGVIAGAIVTTRANRGFKHVAGRLAAGPSAPTGESRSRRPIAGETKRAP